MAVDAVENRTTNTLRDRVPGISITDNPAFQIATSTNLPKKNNEKEVKSGDLQLATVADESELFETAQQVAEVVEEAKQCHEEVTEVLGKLSAAFYF